MISVAIVGASGLVGEAMRSIVAAKMPSCKLRLFGDKSAGTTVSVGGKAVTIEHVEKLTTLTGGYALFATSNDVSRKWIPVCLNNGVTVIDNSSAFRLDDDVPLVVPCVNGELITADKNLYANPNCTTIQVCVAMNALKSIEPTRMNVVTMQAASGAGREGLIDLMEKRTYGRLGSFAHPIVDNVLPKIGEMNDNGFTSEELKMKFESRKILQLPSLAVNCVCTRVAVSTGHSAWINAQFRKPFSTSQVRELLRQQSMLLLLDNAAADLYPMPSLLRSTRYVGVGRISVDETTENGLNMFVVADNLLRGAAYNAFEIMEKAIELREKKENR